MRSVAGLALLTASVLLLAVTVCGMARPAAEDMSFAASGRQAEVRAVELLRGGGVNVNTAPAEELMTLPGIGPVLAQAIIDERTARGSFHYPEDLIAVKGIGPKTLAGLIGKVTLADADE